ncbi:hypothetical protein B0T17DRAFT_110853 [Bombardia bombarda]|uniref:Fucose-specific lectin n=1 Tax=Bombardia bombarda TaxID=252184 RepID=A0AA39W9T1_9PEZI|nr:hypothetical protein B0T17DRAFT_110853 [Bombardia bombarda]
MTASFDNAHMDASQPGLEVVPQERVYHTEQWPQIQNQDVGMEAVQDSRLEPVYIYHNHHQDKQDKQDEHESPNEPATPFLTRSSRWRRPWVIIACIALVIVVVGAVIGGVLGSRAVRMSNSDASSSPTAGSSPTASNSTSNGTSNGTLTTSLIRQGSMLTVAGWRKPLGVEIYLFYQDDRGGLRYSRYDGSRAFSTEKSPNNTYWDTSASFNSFAQNGTHLASTMIVYHQDYQPQTEIFYIGAGSQLLGSSFNPTLPGGFNVNGAINNQNFYTNLSTTSVASFWPYVIYQRSSGQIVRVRNVLDENWGPVLDKWIAVGQNITGLVGTKLAVVPLTSTFSEMCWIGGYGIIYQDTNNRLAAYVPDLERVSQATDYEASWPTGTQLNNTNFPPSLVLPKNSPIAAFTVARPSDTGPKKRVNTYILYLDESSDINVIYNVDEKSWKTSQPEVLRGADPDTNIACLTLTMSASNGTGKLMNLEEATGDNRCYFQRGGEVVEAVMSPGMVWTVTESVLIV